MDTITPTMKEQQRVAVIERVFRGEASVDYITNSHFRTGINSCHRRTESVCMSANAEASHTPGYHATDC